jgi:hypothetical protein
MRVLVISSVVGPVTELFGQVESGSDLFANYFEVVQLFVDYIIICIFLVKALKSRKKFLIYLPCLVYRVGSGGF